MAPDLMIQPMNQLTLMEVKDIIHYLKNIYVSGKNVITAELLKLVLKNCPPGVNLIVRVEQTPEK